MKQILIFLILGTFFTSCGIFKSAPERPTHRAEKERTTPRPKEPVEEREVEIIIPPIEEDEKTDTLGSTPADEVLSFPRKDQYSFELILPLVAMDNGGLITIPEEEESEYDLSGYSEDNETLLPFNQHFINYMSGFLMALQKLDGELPQFSYKINVRSSGDFDSLLVNEKDWSLSGNPDIIIGGVSSAGVEQLSSLSAQNNLFYISPWITHQPFSDNPLMMQLTPGMEEYCRYIVDFLVENSQSPAFTVMTSKSFDNRLNYFEDEVNELDSALMLQTFIVDAFRSDSEPIDLPEWFSKDKPNDIVIAMDRDESFLYDALSYLQKWKDYEFNIYGFSSWKNYDLLHEFFDEGNIYLISHSHRRSNDSSYFSFESDYYDRFSSLPSEWAIKGYDHGMFIGLGVSTFGLDFYAFLDQTPYHGLQLFFDFPTTADEHIEGLSPLHTNQGVQLLEYRDKMFVPVKD
jgi:hypothetical protein